MQIIYSTAWSPDDHQGCLNLQVLPSTVPSGGIQPSKSVIEPTTFQVYLKCVLYLN